MGERVICVLAGNCDQYKDWIKKNHPELIEDFYFRNCEYQYIDKIEHLNGFKVDDVKVIGTFWERKDADNIYMHAKIAQRRNEANKVLMKDYK